MSDLLQIVPVDGVQASRCWPALAPGFARSLPPGVAPGQSLLNSMLAGILQKSYSCWILKTFRDGKEKFAGGLLTEVKVDVLSQTRTLWVYSLFTIQPLSEEEWNDGIKKIKAIAKAFKCSRIHAYSKHPAILKTAERMGGKTEMRLIEVEV